MQVTEFVRSLNHDSNRIESYWFRVEWSSSSIHNKASRRPSLSVPMQTLLWRWC